MLVRPDHARVDRDHPLDLADRIVLDDHLVQDLLPGAVRGPQSQPFMCGLPGAVPFGQVTPRCTGAQLPQDRVDHLPMITPPPTPARYRQQRFNPRPRPIRQFTPTCHRPRSNQTSRKINYRTRSSTAAVRRRCTARPLSFRHGPRPCRGGVALAVLASALPALIGARYQDDRLEFVVYRKAVHGIAMYVDSTTSV